MERPEVEWAIIVLIALGLIYLMATLASVPY